MYQDQGGKSSKWMSSLREKMGLVVDVNYAWHKGGNYFIKRPINKLHPLEIRNSDNSVFKDSSENNDVIYYGRANRPKRLAAERGALIGRLNKQK